MKLTPKQVEANRVLAGPATHALLEGGSRSGKTFLITRGIVVRALKAPKSRHAQLRFRFNAIVPSIIEDTFPSVMAKCFPQVDYSINRSLWFARFPNDSELWWGGLDDKERTEKVLGQEHATIHLNECSQIPWASRGIAVTRLAQRVMTRIEGVPPAELALRMWYDQNPPSKAHWSFRLFREKVDPDTREPLRNPEQFAFARMNPRDNRENLAAGYIETLEALPAHLRRRFLDGEYAEATPNALFDEVTIEKWRADGKLPDMVRVIVAVDPSGASDTGENTDNDEVGIVVTGLGTDGNAYPLEDLTVKAGPTVWGRVAVEAALRHKADAVVGETNFGGGMVEFVVKAAASALGTRVTFRMVTASRGKVQRAEPFSVLYNDGKVRHAGRFVAMEDEMTAFSTSGYKGSRSPNRADALFWSLAALFPAVVGASGRKTVEVAPIPMLSPFARR